MKDKSCGGCLLGVLICGLSAAVMAEAVAWIVRTL